MYKNSSSGLEDQQGWQYMNGTAQEPTIKSSNVARRNRRIATTMPARLAKKLCECAGAVSQRVSYWLTSTQSSEAQTKPHLRESGTAPPLARVIFPLASQDTRAHQMW